MIDQNESYTIEIFELLQALWKHKLIIIIFAIIGFMLAVVKINFFTTPTYTASGTIYVSNRATSSNEEIDTVSKNDIDTARTLSATYIETLKTRSFLINISRETGSRYSWESIKQMLKITPINETELLLVEVTTDSAVDSFKLADAILKLAPQKLADVSEGGSIKIIDEVLIPNFANNNNAIRTVGIYTVAAIILAILLIVLIMLTDTKIHKSEDIEKKYNISVLGILDN